jgi:hypothetical protein
VNDAEFGREDHGSIPTTTIERGLKPLDTRTDPEQVSTGGEKKKEKTLPSTFKTTIFSRAKTKRQSSQQTAYAQLYMNQNQEIHGKGEKGFVHKLRLEVT